MSSEKQVLAQLEPHVAEVLSVVDRSCLFTTQLRDKSFLGKDYLTAAYPSRVDGEDYVVSVADARMTPDETARILGNVARYDMYATSGEQSQAWVARNKRIHGLTSRFRPLFAGYISIEPRDAYDIYASHDPLLSRGMIGYTLRRGSNAILQTTSNMTEDPEFFLRAVGAVNLQNYIDQKTNFSVYEQQVHTEIHGPIIKQMDRLLARDGLPASAAFEKYADLYEESEDISTAIALALQLDAALEPNVTHPVRSATYCLGEGTHLLITKHGDNNRHSFSVLLQQTINGEKVIRRFQQLWDFPEVVLADTPSGGLLSLSRNKRLFALKSSDALDLNAILKSLE
jgi:hypothetical protein